MKRTTAILAAALIGMSAAITFAQAPASVFANLRAFISEKADQDTETFVAALETTITQVIPADKQAAFVRALCANLNIQNIDPASPDASETAKRRDKNRRHLTAMYQNADDLAAYIVANGVPKPIQEE